MILERSLNVVISGYSRYNKYEHEGVNSWNHA